MKRFGWLAAAAFAAACSGGGDTSAPAPTSPVSGPATSAASNGAGATNSDGKTTTSGSASTSARVTGSVSALAGSCPAITFTLGGKSVTTNASTTFGDAGCTGVRNGVTAAAEGAVQGDGSILAKAVRVAPPPPAVASGKVSAVSGTCPSISFTVGGKTVKTNAATRYFGGGCADVKNDASAGASGALQADGSILAAEVKIVPPPPPPPVTLSGKLSALAGTCPTVSFTLGGKTVKTAATTEFGGGTCADLKNDAAVTAIGATQSDGSVLAKGVRILPPPPATVSGKVSALSGACPAISFSLGGKTVKTNASTAFSGGACADVKNDATAGAMGALQSDGSILAAQVKIVPPAPTPVLIGEVTAVSGTCPVITITVGGKTAVTSAATTYEGKACADVKVGVKVGVFGAVPSGATAVAATRVVVR